jgi:hypothetical protein
VSTIRPLKAGEGAIGLLQAAMRTSNSVAPLRLIEDLRAAFPSAFTMFGASDLT